MNLETVYTKNLKWSPSLQATYYKFRDFCLALMEGATGKKRAFLQPSSKTLKALIVLKEEQIYKRKT